MSSNSKLVRPVRIAISGKSGCGNSSLVAELSQRLDIVAINYTFRSLAADLGKSFEEIRQEAEHSDQHDREVDRKQVELALQQESCVMGSRLAIWMLKQSDVKIYLDINIQERSRRIHRRESGLLDHKMAETQARDQLDHDRYLRLYQINNDDFKELADIIIVDEKLSVNQIADQVMAHLINKHYLAC